MTTINDLEFAITQMEIFRLTSREMKKCLRYLPRLARGVNQFVVLLHLSDSEWKRDAKGTEGNCYKTFLLSLLTYEKAKFIQPEKLDYVEEVVHEITAENFPGLEDHDVEEYTTEDFASLEPKKHEVNLQNFPGLGDPTPKPKFDPGKSFALDSGWD